MNVSLLSISSQYPPDKHTTLIKRVRDFICLVLIGLGFFCFCFFCCCFLLLLLWFLLSLLWVFLFVFGFCLVIFSFLLRRGKQKTLMQ